MADEKKPETQPPKNTPDPKPVEEMTEEEQMEAYEESLKDTDWGHNPVEDVRGKQQPISSVKWAIPQRLRASSSHA